MKLNEYREHIVKLVEERGVAAYKYNDTIGRILNYIQNRISLNGSKHNTKITFDIPSYYLKEFKFLHEPIIEVTNTDVTDHNVTFENGTGECTIHPDYTKIVNGKLCNVLVKIRCFSIMNELVDKTFLNVLYHELNHAYDIFKDYERNGNIERFNNDRLRAYSPQINTEKENVYWKEVFYRLFSSTELNGLIASVYGDLQGIKSVRKNFHKDYKETLAFKAYEFFTRNLKYALERTDDESLKRIINKIPHPIKSDNINDIKVHVMDYVLKRCAKLLRGIGRAASLYYDRVEDKGEKWVHCDYGSELYEKKDFYSI